MRCIVLYEKHDSGKSTSLCILIDNIVASGGVIDLGKDKIYGMAGSIGVDRVVRIKYHEKTIGITSRGDDRKVLEEDFSYLGKCDFYICAARTKGETRDYLKSTYDDEVVWQRKWRVEGCDTMSLKDKLTDEINMSQAQMLKKVLDNIL